jgi:hypothetical protein
MAPQDPNTESISGLRATIITAMHGIYTSWKRAAVCLIACYILKSSTMYTKAGEREETWLNPGSYMIRHVYPSRVSARQDVITDIGSILQPRPVPSTPRQPPNRV